MFRALTILHIKQRARGTDLIKSSARTYNEGSDLDLLQAQGESALLLSLIR
jgi:hypothetical protein